MPKPKKPIAWKKFITISIRVRCRYCGAQISRKVPRLT
ncbi:hypothetical protein FPK37_25580, partial [Acinetobacter baumannii]|nr:hypothetical protein [Acinetobacter baumannii]